MITIFFKPGPVSGSLAFCHNIDQKKDSLCQRNGTKMCKKWTNGNQPIVAHKKPVHFFLLLCPYMGHLWAL